MGAVRTPWESLHWKRQWEKNPLPHQRTEPASVTCRSDALPTELHPNPPPSKSFIFNLTGRALWRKGTDHRRRAATRARSLHQQSHWPTACAVDKQQGVPVNCCPHCDTYVFPRSSLHQTKKEILQAPAHPWRFQTDKNNENRPGSSGGLSPGCRFQNFF